MLLPILSILLAILPGLVICILIYKSDKYEKEPWSHLLVCFLLGVIAMFIARSVENFLESAAYDFAIDMPDLLFHALIAFVVVAFVEEFLKFLPLRFYIFPRKAFNEPMDGIVYGVMIGMGFATAENMMYVSSGNWETALIRMFTAVPAHGMIGVIMGYFAGQAKFNPHQRFQLLMQGFWLAVLGHGAYDFFILQENYPALAILSLVLLAIGYWVTIRLVRREREKSPFKESGMP